MILNKPVSLNLVVLKLADSCYVLSYSRHQVSSKSRTITENNAEYAYRETDGYSLRSSSVIASKIGSVAAIDSRYRL